MQRFFNSSIRVKTWALSPERCLTEEIMRVPKAQIIKHWSVFTSYYSVKWGFLIRRKLDIKPTKGKTCSTSTLLRSFIQSTGKYCHRNSLNGLPLEPICRCSLNLMSQSDDVKKIHELALKKINEAHELLQEKLAKAKEESKKVVDKSEKQALEILIKSTEESIDQLLELKRKIKNELKKKK
uniref:30S ribosomal protein S8 n=1 Tax=Lygus hesperus TaxID=30085 RepID=A0A0A9X5E8_LYGHE